MKVCFVVDARSPIARNWITHFIERRYEVHVLSTYPCPPDALPGATLHQVPVAFSKLSRVSHAGGATGMKSRPLLSPLLASARSGALSNIGLAAHLWLTPLELRRHVQPTRDLIAKISPDLVHAMRIPFEGILAARAIPAGMRLLISVWGNDFTLCATNNPLVARQTKLALRRADALHCDCRRDLNLAAREWGFDPQKPSVTLPGAGGIQPSLFYEGDPDPALKRRLNIPGGAPVVINPRGFRGYVRNDVFFRAIPQVLLDHPDAIFVCTSMQSNPVAEGWVRKLAIRDSVRLLPLASREQMADLFRAARVAVSPSLHDGTPNSLLEALACGCFPVAGDIESVREWIEDGYNGLLCDPNDSRSVARAISRALADEQLRNRARDHNTRLIAERAEYGEVMRQAEEFYARLARQRPKPIEV